MEYNEEDLKKAITILSSNIAKCEKIQPKFSEGSSQHSLLKNRIKALYVSRSLLMGDTTINYTCNDLKEALPPIISIINKTTKAQSKYEKGTTQFNRFEPLIQAMLISKDFIQQELNND